MVHVTELPIRKWTQDYKEYLENLIKPEDKGQKALLSDYKEFHTGANVHFELQPVEGAVPEEEAAQLLVKFKLTSKLALSKQFQFPRLAIRGGVPENCYDKPKLIQRQIGSDKSMPMQYTCHTQRERSQICMKIAETS